MNVNINDVLIGIRKAGTIDDSLLVKRNVFPGIDAFLYIPDDDGTKLSCCSIKREALQIIEVDEEDLWNKAYDNIKAESNMFYLFDSPMLVVTNEIRFMGAASILDTETVKKIKLMLKSDHAIVIPSSIHEVICLPAEDDIINENINGIISSVNSECVDAEEQLGDKYFII